MPICSGVCSRKPSVCRTRPEASSPQLDITSSPQLDITSSLQLDITSSLQLDAEV